MYQSGVKGFTSRGKPGQGKPAMQRIGNLRHGHVWKSIGLD